jgi:hypothetical protein
MTAEGSESDITVTDTNRIPRSCKVEQQQMVASILSFPQSTMKFIERVVQVYQQGGWRREAGIQINNVTNFLSKQATSHGLRLLFS